MGNAEICKEVHKASKEASVEAQQTPTLIVD